MTGSDCLIIASLIIAFIACVIWYAVWLFQSGINDINDYNDWNDHV